jgi:uncharacterized protein (DUF433 family)
VRPCVSHLAATLSERALASERNSASLRVMGGRACIRGMRITVALVINLVANGMSTEDIIREYPELEVEDIRPSLQYASALANEEIGFFKSPAA